MADLVSLLMQLDTLPDAAKALALGVALSIAGFGLWGTARTAVRGAVVAGRLSWRGGAALLAWCRRPSQTALLRAEIAQLREELGA